MTAALPLDALTHAVRKLPGGGLSDARRAALASFAAQGFPSVRDEDWKYTDLAGPIEISRAWLTAGSPEEAPDPETIRATQAGLDAHWLVIANGALLVDYSTALALPGITAQSEAAPADRSAPLADLNTALSQGVLDIRFDRTHVDDKPVAILLADTAATAAIASQVRIRISLEASAAASFIEYHVSSGAEAHYSNTLIELDLGANATCRYVRIQDRALHHSQTARLDARLAHDSNLSHFAVDLGGELARNDLNIDIQGTNASARLNGVYLAGPGQHVDNHTRTDHRVGPARSSQEYRGVLSGRCRAVWNGKAIVHRGADGTDAHQANHNLLLSEHAEIDAKPELEIYADDVKCAHGTTVGQLDERALFYLRTRGLGLARAQRILTRAFAASVVDTVPLEVLHDRIGEKVEARLRQMAAGETP